MSSHAENSCLRVYDNTNAVLSCNVVSFHLYSNTHTGTAVDRTNSIHSPSSPAHTDHQQRDHTQNAPSQARNRMNKYISHPLSLNQYVLSSLLNYIVKGQLKKTSGQARGQPGWPQTNFHWQSQFFRLYIHEKNRLIFVKWLFTAESMCVYVCVY